MVEFSSAPLGTSATARELKLSESRVRQLAEAGKLRSARTEAGQYLFDPVDVEQFRVARSARRDA